MIFNTTRALCEKGKSLNLLTRDKEKYVYRQGISARPFPKKMYEYLGLKKKDDDDVCVFILVCHFMHG